MRKLERHSKDTDKKKNNRRSTNLSGSRFGRLFVIGRYGVYNPGDKHKQISTWECICDCGNSIIVRRDNLRSGATQSCGCLQKERSGEAWKLNALAPGVAAFNSLILSYKKGAKSRNLIWNLSDQQAKSIFESKCHYCGIEPFALWDTGKGNGRYKYNGIDRLDNLIGYELANCVSCCKFCNYAKRNRSYDDFLAWIRRACEFIDNRSGNH